MNSIIKIIEILKKEYPDCRCSLNFSSPFEITIAVMLSAQCTDDRVNQTTPELFKHYGTPSKLASANREDVEKIIHKCGFYRNKAKNAILCSKMIVDEYNGNVPDNMQDLMRLPGIGRKSANVIMLEAFKKPQGIAVDTHVKRISNRIGLSKNNDPEKIEQDLLKIIPKKYYYDVNHLLVWHGRKTCSARKPNCEACAINKYCKKYKVGG